MSNTPFFKTDCPSCGAPVEAHSATAVTLVCGYCNSMLVRQDDSIVDSGRDSALLEDFSPLQIGTTGTYVTRPFTLVGRLQVQYDDGVWNEWYALFDDGQTGWLSESGDLYSMTRLVESPEVVPEFHDVVPGGCNFNFQNKNFVPSDKREISLRKSAAQGELPFKLTADTTSKVIDWRCSGLFLTIDYGDDPPEIYYGSMVGLNELKLQNTRTDDQIRETAGRLKGSHHSENCPNCGSSVHWLSGVTDFLICPSCGSQLEVGKEKARLITANAMRVAQDKLFTLPIGKQGRLNNNDYFVMGAVRYSELDPDATYEYMFEGKRRILTPVGWWVEYLLYNPQKGFAWLVESSDGEWSQSETQNNWPRLNNARKPQGCNELYSYGGKVEVAAGAFYWHIRSGDLAYYTDYQVGSNGKLCAELTEHELAWSKSTRTTYGKVASAFGLQAEAPRYTAKMSADGVDNQLRLVMTAILVVVNLPALLTDDNSATLAVIFIGTWLLWSMGKEDEDED